MIVITVFAKQRNKNYFYIILFSFISKLLNSHWIFKFSLNLKFYKFNTPGAVFTTLHFLCNLRMGPISWSVTWHWVGKAYKGQTLSLFLPFESCEENEVLWIQHRLITLSETNTCNLLFCLPFQWCPLLAPSRIIQNVCLV